MSKLYEKQISRYTDIGPFSRKRELLKEAKNYWKNGIRPPDIILIHPGKLTARVSILKELNDWIDLD
jgi:hypothetical protein